MASVRWSAIDAPRARWVPRMPLTVDGREVGSVATDHLDALRR
jgi:hypothetical protein